VRSVVDPRCGLGGGAMPPGCFRSAGRMFSSTLNVCTEGCRGGGDENQDKGEKNQAYVNEKVKRCERESERKRVCVCVPVRAGALLSQRCSGCGAQSTWEDRYGSALCGQLGGRVNLICDVLLSLTHTLSLSLSRLTCRSSIIVVKRRIGCPRLRFYGGITSQRSLLNSLSPSPTTPTELFASSS
jgi:hypothetical protein